jgi:hypothetical protein
LDRLRELHADYREHAGFLFVCIRDADHPPANLPRDREARRDESERDRARRLAEEGLNHYSVPFPVLLDDGTSESAYDAYPKRLIVIDAAGRIVHDAGRGASGGPSDWDLERVERVLRAAIETDR